jgi:hypothetical protein
MTVSVIEYGGFQSGRPMASGVPQVPPLQVTQFSSAATSTGFFLPGTRYVQVFTSGPNAWALFTGTTSSTIALSTATSTNSIPIAPNVLVGFYVPPNPASLTGSAANSLTPGSTLTSTSGFRYSILSS